MKPRLMLAAAAVLALFIFGSSKAYALCLLCTCTTSSNGLDFSTYDPTLAIDTQVNGTITVGCSLAGTIALGVAYQISLNAGGSNSYTTRQLSKGANKLNYNLYVSNAYNQVWGDGTGSTGTITDGYLLAVGAPATMRNYTVFGKITQLQNVPKGTYTDTLVISVLY